MAAVESVLDCNNQLAEGPTWHPGERALYWVDVTSRRIHRWTPSTGEHRTWTPAQLTTFLELARHDRLYAMWLLLATTGVRRSEVAGLRRDALDSTSPQASAGGG